MKPRLFFSYSRREVGFVDDLSRHLESDGYNVWLDYRSLVPGKPWEEQIFQGISNADVILLVVSKESMASRNVEVEWKKVIEQTGKRIILLIFEAVDLPAVLEKYEWVDFRGNYKAALKELDRQLQMPQIEEHPAPQTGFKIPSMVWVAFLLSLVTAVASLGALWTVFIPYYLLTLPFKIFKRNFQYMFVQASLVMLPVALYLTSLFSTDQDTVYVIDALAIVSVPFVIGLLLVLRSSAMQRWGKPEALRPSAAQHMEMDLPQPQPVSFYVEHAPQDRVLAGEMTEALLSHGHQVSEDAHSARSVFTLISAYKDDSQLDCQKHVVYPVILQTNDKISRQLSRVQWLDFRSGLRNIHAVGKLLNEPEKILKTLCTRPTGKQLVMPPTIMYLVYFIAFLAVVCIGSWIPYVAQYLPEFINYVDFDGPVMQLVLSLILFGLISYFMGWQIVQRRGWLASVPGLIVGFLALGLIIYWQGVIDQSILDILNIEVDYRGFSSLYSYYLYMYGGAVMAVYLFIKRQELKRWLPVTKP